METILLIEEDPANLIALSLILRCFGYTVLEAVNRGEAWRVCCEHPGPVHLVTMNAVLKDDDSNEFIARLQLVCPRIGALFLTDASPAEFSDNQRLSHERTFLQKPFPASTLADTIRRLLDRLERRAASLVS
jgi:two-component system cell cycle sensor histidine kinase/response regulator CckA